MMTISLLQVHPALAGTVADESLCDTSRTQLYRDTDTNLCVKQASTADGVAGSRSINELVIRIINVLLGIAAIVAVLYIVIGGFRYMTSAGNEEQAKGGRKTVINALVGLAIIILAYALVSIVNNAVSNCGGILSRYGILFGC